MARSRPDLAAADREALLEALHADDPLRRRDALRSAALRSGELPELADRWASLLADPDAGVRFLAASLPEPAWPRPPRAEHAAGLVALLTDHAVPDWLRRPVEPQYPLHAVGAAAAGTLLRWRSRERDAEGVRRLLGAGGVAGAGARDALASIPAPEDIEPLLDALRRAVDAEVDPPMRRMAADALARCLWRTGAPDAVGRLLASGDEAVRDGAMSGIERLAEDGEPLGAAVPLLIDALDTPASERAAAEALVAIALAEGARPGKGAFRAAGVDLSGFAPVRQVLLALRAAGRGVRRAR